MIAKKGFIDFVYDRKIFSDPECPDWAKCVVANADGSIIFLDTVPSGINEKEERWNFPNWQFVRCFYSSHKAEGDWRNSLLLREAVL